jgi:hypothetical protein
MIAAAIAILWFLLHGGWRDEELRGRDVKLFESHEKWGRPQVSLLVRPGPPVIFQDVVHSVCPRRLDCSLQSASLVPNRIDSVLKDYSQPAELPFP